MTQTATEGAPNIYAVEEYAVHDEPYYLPISDEVRLFETAYEQRIPVLLKGPTGCGKTRFVEHMAYRLRRPLITVACHEDLTASDLVGRYLLTATGPSGSTARCRSRSGTARSATSTRS